MSGRKKKANLKGERQGRSEDQTAKNTKTPWHCGTWFCQCPTPGVVNLGCEERRTHVGIVCLIPKSVSLCESVCACVSVRHWAPFCERCVWLCLWVCLSRPSSLIRSSSLMFLSLSLPLLLDRSW